MEAVRCPSQMKRVAIYTNLHKVCGSGIYGHELAAALSRWYDVIRVEADDRIDNLQTCGNADVAILNWHAARVPLSASKIAELRETGTRVILIHQNTSAHFAGNLSTDDQNEILAAAELVVTHEPFICPFPTVYIPIGVPEISPLPSINQFVTIGTAGFPFPWKRTDVVVKVAERLECYAHIVASRYGNMDFSADYANWRDRLGQHLDLWTDFEPVDSVVCQLARCWVNIFWFESKSSGDELGQSGSARLGVAAQRPMIISRHRKFETFKPYADEFYVAKSPRHALRIAKRIIRNIQEGLPVHIPNRILKDQGWSRVGKMFADLIEGLFT